MASWAGAGKVPAAAINIQPKQKAALELAPGRWLMEARAPGFWGEPLQLELASGEVARAVTLRLWPSAVLLGGVTLPGGEDPPPDFAAFFRPAPGVPPAKGVPPGRTICSIQGKKWACGVPAGHLDVRFQASGFIPLYLWGVQVGAGTTLEVGSTSLVRGSAVQGWLVTATGSGLPEGARVTLRPRGTQALTNLDESRRASSLGQVAEANDRGFFQFDAVPPGEYLLQATASRFISAETSIRVFPDQVTEVANPPLTLSEPLTLRAYLTPPLDPWGEPWQIELSRLDRASLVFEREAPTPTDPGGSWVGEGLRPGRLSVSVKSSRGGTWWSQEVELEAETPALHIDVEVVEVIGRLSLGKTPLAAKLFFGGKHGEIRAQTSSDESGEFILFLPKPGVWKIAVSAADPPVERELRAVQVNPKPGSSRAELILRLPDTKVRGKVLDENGKAVAGAYVGLSSTGPAEAGQVHVETNQQGRFEVHGVAEGSLRVEAEAGRDLRSDIETVEVHEGRETGPLTLVLQKSLIVPGMAGSSAGAVPGAGIKALPVGSPFLGVGAVASDSQGRFELRLPRRTQEVHLSAGAPGFAFRTFRQSIPKDGPLSIGLRQESGTLVVESSEPIDWQSQGDGIYILHEGGVESLGYLVGWAYRNGISNTVGDQRRIVIPFVEPGEYVVCWLDATARAALDVGILPIKGCDKGTLHAHGELTLAPSGR